MLQKALCKVSNIFGPLPWHPKPTRGDPDEGWLLLEATPLPPPEQLYIVISDICWNRLVFVGKDRRVYHSNNCTVTDHSIPKHIRKVVEKAIPLLTPETFKVAVNPGDPRNPETYPQAIALEPEISYRRYPDHPHLGIIYSFSNNLPNVRLFSPDVSCYIDHPTNLGIAFSDRLEEAIGKICIWLLRHQVWAATREFQKCGIWIGLGTAPRKPEDYPDLLNPFGKCRCGIDTMYIDCHMISDITQREKCTKQQARTLVQRYIKHWPTNTNRPQLQDIEKLKKLLLIAGD